MDDLFQQVLYRQMIVCGHVTGRSPRGPEIYKQYIAIVLTLLFFLLCFPSKRITDRPEKNKY